MKIEYIRDPITKMKMKVLLIEDFDEPKGLCENCSNTYYTHPQLRKTMHNDWCLDCNDEEFMRKNKMGQKEFALWTASEISKDKIILIISRVVE